MSVFWKKVIGTIAGLIALSGLIFGLSEYEQKFARAEYVERVENDLVQLRTRFETKQLVDRLYAIERRIWAIEDQFGGPGAPNASPALRQEYLALRLERDNIKRELGKK